LKFVTSVILAVLCTAVADFGATATLEEYLAKANGYKENGQFDDAISTMEQAVKEYPEQAEAYAQLGVMLSEKAQRIKELTPLFEIAQEAFTAWDKALILDPANFIARFYRGAWSINTPKSIGRLASGIKDFEILAQALEKSPDPSAKGRLVEVYQYLANGYQRNGEYKKARNIYETIVGLAPGTEYAGRAQQNIGKITEFEQWQSEREKKMKADTPEIMNLKGKLAGQPGNFDLLLSLGRAYYNIERYEAAAQVLRQAVSIDQSNGEAYRLLANALLQVGAVAYDPRIYMDTNFRTDLVFESMAALDKAVALAPADMELKLTRGINAVRMPFFVNKLEQGIEDLESVSKSDVSDEMKAQAAYWLGYAHQKMATTYWTRVISKYPATEAAQDVFTALRPPVQHIDLSGYDRPVISIDFELSYRDELAPQTAVWVEDSEGKFVKTIYVSGFSGNAKEQQVDLPVYARSSGFADVDAVTGASIDLGQHVYVWDLKDHAGKKIASGDYTVFVEVSYWPSMQYQRVEAPIKIGKKDARVVVQEGNLIPYLEVHYLK
jgi:tetratricopeptide (TPR) repeat protein